MKLKNKKLLTRFVRTIGLLTIITIISKILGLLREIGIASYFGVGSITDAFYAALIIPALLFSSVGVAIQNLFMIEFTSVKKQYEDKLEESKLASNVSNILLVISFTIFIISFIFTPTIIRVIAPGFKDPDKFDITIKLTRILLPTMLIIPIYQVRASMLRVYNRFVTVAIIDLCFNVFQLVYLLLFSKKLGIYGLAYSILFAYLFQLIVIEIINYKMGFKEVAILDFNNKHWKTILRLFIPTFISFGIIQVNAMVDKIIASNLGDGAITALNYGFMVRTVIYTILISTILLVIYPTLLKLIEKKDFEKYQKTASTSLMVIFKLSIPVTIFIILFHDSIIRILYERGEFDSNATLMTSKVLLYYIIGLTFYAIKELLIHISYTYKNTKMPLVVTLIGCLLNIIFSIILKIWMGVYGVALGLAVSEFISFIIILIWVNNKKYLNISKTLKKILYLFFINLLLGMIVYVLKENIIITNNKIMELIIIGLFFGIWALVYLLILKFTKSSLLEDFVMIMNGKDEND